MQKEYRWTFRDENGKAHFKIMDPDCGSCWTDERPCPWLSICMEKWENRMADLEDRLDIT